MDKKTKSMIVKIVVTLALAVTAAVLELAPADVMPFDLGNLPFLGSSSSVKSEAPK